MRDCACIDREEVPSSGIVKECLPKEKTFELHLEVGFFQVS